MPSTRSTAKRLRQATRRAQRNRAAKSRLRRSVKKVHQAIETGNREEAVTAFRAAVAMIDKTTSRGIIHPRTAARYKSRLAHRLRPRREVAA
ncbi:MAG: 30S ribosomal protein S20 [Candidatus Methylomirabilales bacterium]